jgi:hypothetical protein
VTDERRGQKVNVQVSGLTGGGPLWTSEQHVDDNWRPTATSGPFARLRRSVRSGGPGERRTAPGGPAPVPAGWTPGRRSNGCRSVTLSRVVLPGAGGLGCRAPPCTQLDRLRLTANLTANRSDSCRSMATATYEPEPSSCRDGWQRTAPDGWGRVRSPPVACLGSRLASSYCGAVPRAPRPAIRRS